jgi:nitrate/TMAO reductase-like tetraheme cytochrome c subunit
VEGSGEAPRARCLGCHNQPDKLDRYPDTALLHKAHVTERTIDCVRCHTEIQHKLPPPIGAPTAEARPGALVAGQARP